jgi:hypothetical protein
VGLQGQVNEDRAGDLRGLDLPVRANRRFDRHDALDARLLGAFGIDRLDALQQLRRIEPLRTERWARAGGRGRGDREKAPAEQKNRDSVLEHRSKLLGARLYFPASRGPADSSPGLSPRARPKSACTTLELREGQLQREAAGALLFNGADLRRQFVEQVAAVIAAAMRAFYTGKMLLRVCAAALLAAFMTEAMAGQPAARSRQFWLSPGPGTIDYIRLFDHPEEWPLARDVTGVFKFYQQHTQTPADPIVGPNTYDALVRARAFRRLMQWRKKIAVEVGAVKEFYCTPDASGMRSSIAGTVAAVQAIERAGGIVSYLAMDEPFVSGRARICGGPALEPTADRVATFVAGVRAARPAVQVGLIEAYPFSSADAIEAILTLLDSRGAKPAFLHMDVDWHLSGREAFRRDMKRLQGYCGAQQIPFGIIITGYNGDSDTLYADDVEAITELTAETFDTWTAMPDHIILQSWAESRTGQRITPTNLPERQPYSHTYMLFRVFRRLLAGGAATGGAIPR